MDPSEALNEQLIPWEEAVGNPERAQRHVLGRYLGDYARTGYGADHGAAALAEEAAEDDGSVASLVAKYRESFPVMTHDQYKPLIEAVMAGETSLLLCEDPIGWAITRGTVEGESKFIPMTPTDLRMRVSAGRAMMAYVASTKRFDLFAGVNLNLNFPSTVGTIAVGDKQLDYGYSSGIYTKHVSRFTPIRSVPASTTANARNDGSRKWAGSTER